MNKFIAALNKEDLRNAYTENGAVTFSSTGSANLDFFALASAKRGQFNQVVDLFIRALHEDEDLAVRNIFYLRDVRQGQGERDLFRACLATLILMDTDHDRISKNFLELVPEYGRWDDLIYMFGFNHRISVMISEILSEQLERDIEDMNNNRPCSLLAKWFPLENNTRNKNKRVLAKTLRNFIFTDARSARKIISKLRNYIDVLERKISSKEYGRIEYKNVPSKAAMLYRKAFLKHDTERYKEYIESLKKGETTINASVTYPYEIIRAYRINACGKVQNDFLGWNYILADHLKYKDETLELIWKNLPDYTGANKKAICVVDVSGSMMGGKDIIPMDVAISLGMYFAERNVGPFKDHFITFSTYPHLIRIKGETLLEKVYKMSREDWDGSTDIQEVFNLVLNAAKRNKLSQEDMPETIYIISDMEFNHCCDNYTNYELITKKYEEAGYKKPNIVFWNVASRNTNVPVTKDESGTILVSGCSPSIFKSVISGQTPEKFMLEILNGPRYNFISLDV